MILCVSIGNTNIRCAVGTKEQNQQIELTTKTIYCSKDFISNLERKFDPSLWQAVNGSIVTSVVTDKTPIITDAIYQKTNKLPRRIEISKLGIDISKYNGNLGEDRAICCAAAFAEFTPPIIVVDLGTATTINFIDADGIFIGGAITAGVQTGLNALNEHTSQLPNVSDFKNVIAIGRDTQEGLISGAVIGTANMIEGYVNRFVMEFSSTPTVVITGGNAPIVLPHLKFNFVHKPTLLIDELFSQYEAFETK